MSEKLKRSEEPGPFIRRASEALAVCAFERGVVLTSYTEHEQMPELVAQTRAILDEVGWEMLRAGDKEAGANLLLVADELNLGSEGLATVLERAADIQAHCLALDEGLIAESPLVELYDSSRAAQ